MSITLDLPSELEDQLSAEANRLNLPLEEYIIRLLSFHSSLEKQPRNGAELVAYWESVGVINSCPDIQDSQEYARQLRYDAEHRKSV